MDNFDEVNYYDPHVQYPLNYVAKQTLVLEKL